MARLGDLVRRLMRVFTDTRGAVSPVMTLLIVPIVGAIAMAAETGGWYYTQRSAQDAADSAALAAATNGCTTGSCGASYALEARAAAARYSFVNGVNNATVTPTYPVTCPDGTNTCYRVTITKVVPVNLARIVGFNGDTTVGSGRGQTVIAQADARSRVNAGFCIMSLGTSNNAFRINGGPNFNLGGCDIYSNGGANCNGGSTYGINAGVAVNNSDCGASPQPNQPAVSDPYASLSTNTNIPTSPTGCMSTVSGSYAGGTINLTSGVGCRTGDLIIGAGTTTINTPADGTVLRITSGNIVLNGNLTVTGGGLTIVFTGPAGNNTPGFFAGTGTVDFSAPTATTNAFKGIAVYQDNRMTRAASWDYSGNSPTFNITGLVYMPRANITLRGAINHATGGLSCLGLVANTMTVSGTGSIFANATSQCAQAGLNLPNGPSLLTRQALVR